MKNLPACEGILVVADYFVVNDIQLRIWMSKQMGNKK